MNEMLKEEQKLRDVLLKYDEFISDVKMEYSNLNNLYHDAQKRIEKEHILTNRIKILSENINSPYFARIDFKNSIDNLIDVCYIGKLGVVDYDNNILVVDWRAPISSIYYDSNVGDCFYKVNDDNVYGSLLLKRQYNIENKVLVSFNDVDTVSNDELLKPYLGVNADKRLKNIIATIQNEQNVIIRSSIANNIVVQGVAGSGKTTVALHRIAYLVYNYQDVIKNKQYMVIGPNKFFVNYISSVLPDLDINDVKQYDIISLANIYLNREIILEAGNTEYSKFKTSLEFKKVIDSYVSSIELLDGDIKVNDFTLISKNEISKIYNDVSLKSYDCLNVKIERIIFLLNNYVIDNKNKILERVNSYFDAINNSDISDTRKRRTELINKINKSNTQLFKAYFNKKIKDIMKLYNHILFENFGYKEKIYFEDLAALIYLNYKINGNDLYQNLKHIVIDEAQDYGALMFLALNKVFSNATFSIYGDLAQSLYPNWSIKTWDEIKAIFNNFSIINLTKSYRTTIEIMTEANKINAYLNLIEADSVIRHGEKVIYSKVSNHYIDLRKNLDSLINSGLTSIAVITKSEDTARLVLKQLKKDYNCQLIDMDNQEYNSGISILTSKMSKGLEYDGVIIYDAGEKIYCHDNDLDLKLLYVAMTRAMHQLIILYNDNLCDVLK